MAKKRKKKAARRRNNNLDPKLQNAVQAAYGIGKLNGAERIIKQFTCLN